MGISNRLDQYGNPLYRRFTWTESNRVMSIPNSQADVIEFLRNHPECEGSKNSSGVVVFKEMNQEKVKFHIC